MNKYYYFIKNSINNNYFKSKNLYNKTKIFEYNHDFSNLYFSDFKKLRKILLQNKTIFNKFEDDYYNYHSFNWIKTAKEIGGSNVVKITRDKIISWIGKHNNFFTNFFDINLVGQRIANLIYHFDFFGTTGSISDKTLINQLIINHYLFLKRHLDIPNKISGGSIDIKKAILLFESIHNLKTHLIIKQILISIDEDISPLGMHLSMNPQKQAIYINDLIEIKNIILFFQNKLPKEIEFTIIKMIRVLKSLIHKDGSLAYFNGANNFYIKNINKIIILEKDLKVKNLNRNKNGLSVFENKNIKIIFDTVLPANKLINYGLHASTLAFELSIGKEKIIANCGSANFKNRKKPDYLRYSAAHSTIILNNTNISELIEKKSYKRIPSKINFDFREDDNNIIWESSHNGYEKNLKKIIKRKLIIDKNKTLVSGYDDFISLSNSENKVSFTIRFHLTPLCKALITRSKMSAIIKTKESSYLFNSNCNLNLEESIYITDLNKVVKTNQIVIAGFVDNFKKTVNWSLAKH